MYNRKGMGVFLGYEITSIFIFVNVILIIFYP